MTDSDPKVSFRPIPFFSAPSARCGSCGEPGTCKLSCDTRKIPAVVPAPTPRSGRPPVQNRIELLLPQFRTIVDSILRDLDQKGYSPVLWETLRTPERGEWLRKKGRSKIGSRSMHCHGIAADIICGEHRWNCPKSCGFFDALGESARAHKVTWGGSWGWDRPHIQAVSVRQQKHILESADVGATVRKLREKL